MAIFSLRVVDLKVDGMIPEWETCLQYIKDECREDPLWSNYLDIPLGEFMSFPVVIEDGVIVAFSGAQYRPDRWGPHTARISTRMWIHPIKREKALTKFSSDQRTWYNSAHVIPRQIQTLHAHPEIRTIFISRHGYRRSFTKFISLVNEQGLDLRVQPGEHWVCGQESTDDSCRQIIAVGSLADHDPMPDIKEYIHEATRP